jgi:hypothetical protein
MAIDELDIGTHQNRDCVGVERHRETDFTGAIQPINCVFKAWLPRADGLKVKRWRACPLGEEYLN